MVQQAGSSKNPKLLPQSDMSSEEEYSEEEEQTQDDGPSEAEIAMRRRQAAKAVTAEGLDDEAKAMLEENAQQRAAMEEEINEMKARSARRKKEREEEEKQAAIRRAEEEKQRKEEEEVRNAEKRAAEEAKKEARAAKMAEFEKWKNNDKPNFVITKKLDAMPMGGDEEDGESGGDKKSKEQLEAEKRAILAQRTPKLEIDGFDTSKLGDKAKELHNLIMRLESEKYDLEKTFKAQQVDMMELAEKARQMNKIGRGGLKRVAGEETDVMSERFAGCPGKIVMFSEFERQTDARNWGQRQEVFKGAHILYPAARIAPSRIVKFDEASGLPCYEAIPGMEKPKAAEEEEEEE